MTSKGVDSTSEVQNGQPDVDDGDASTSSTSIRWKYTNDVLATFVVSAHIALLAASVRWGFEIPRAAWQVFVFEVVIAATWTFGPSTVEAARAAWKGESSSSNSSSSSSSEQRRPR